MIGTRSVVAAASAMMSASCAMAVVNPSIEPFAANNAAWRASDALTGLTWSATGGVADSGYVSTTRSFLNDLPTNPPSVSPPVLMNARLAWNSSDGVFFGDWAGAGVTSMSFDFRHDAPVPLIVFVRIATAGNFPGASFFTLAPVAGGEWTNITLPVNAAYPGLGLEGMPLSSVLGAVGRVQVGVFVPQSLSGTQATYTFGLDNFQIVPAPASALVLGVMGAFAARRRRSTAN